MIPVVGNVRYPSCWIEYRMLTKFDLLTIFQSLVNISLMPSYRVPCILLLLLLSDSPLSLQALRGCVIGKPATHHLIHDAILEPTKLYSLQRLQEARIQMLKGR